MYQDFETDVMDDLFYDAAEGPSRTRRQPVDRFDEYDAMANDFDAFSDGFDEYDAMEDYAEEYDAYDEGDAIDAFEDAMAEALEAEDSDEFVRRFRRALNVARRIGRGVGQAARVIAPIASMIPHPAAQAVGRVASVAGRLMADGADEFEAFEEMVDFAEEEDAVDAAAPALATLAIHNAMPREAARLSQPARRQLIRTTTQATQALARQQGPQAARAITPILQQARRAVRQRRLPPRALPQAVQQISRSVLRNPRLLRRLIRSNPAVRNAICSVCRSRARRATMPRPAL
jgi:hypothetical protein